MTIDNVFRYTIVFEQYAWEQWDYEYSGYDYWPTVEVGYDTKITVTGNDVNFLYHNTVGDFNAFRYHKDVTVYGAIPSNNFNPANVKIDNFSIKKEDTYLFG